MAITNQQVAGHAFLRPLYADAYFPDPVVDKGRTILLRLCGRIEAEQPSDLASLYVLTQAATEEFNLLEAEFEAAGSERQPAPRRLPPGPTVGHCGAQRVPDTDGAGAVSLAL